MNFECVWKEYFLSKSLRIVKQAQSPVNHDKHSGLRNIFALRVYASLCLSAAEKQVWFERVTKIAVILLSIMKGWEKPKIEAAGRQGWDTSWPAVCTNVSST